LRNNEADAASTFAKPRIRKRGENMRPPPRPTIVSTRDIKKTAAMRIADRVMASEDFDP